MNFTRRQVLESAAAGMAAVAAGAPRAAFAATVGEEAQSVPLRTTINNGSPLLLSAVYGNTPDTACALPIPL